MRSMHHRHFKKNGGSCLLGQMSVQSIRDEQADVLERFASYIAAALQVKKGNYIAFFPSYRFLEEVYEKFQRYQTEDVICIVQEQSMDEEKREAFLQAFDQDRSESLIGFCVMGGIFLKELI